MLNYTYGVAHNLAHNNDIMLKCGRAICWSVNAVTSQFTKNQPHDHPLTTWELRSGGHEENVNCDVTSGECVSLMCCEWLGVCSGLCLFISSSKC